MEETKINTSNQIELNSISNSISYFLGDMDSFNITMEQLNLYIEYPMTYNRQLRDLSMKAYNKNGLYANVIDYMITMLNLDFVTVCVGDNKNLKKKKTFSQLLEKINHKATTMDILRNLLIKGMYVGIIRDTKPTNKNLDLNEGIESLDYIEGLAYESNLMIQPLNINYCKVVGYLNNIQIVAYDMQYFDQFKHGGLVSEIKNFPIEFAKAYKDYKKDSSKRWFNLDSNKTIVRKFKANIDEPYGRPLGISGLFDMKFAYDYNNSQVSTVNDLASSIYYMILPQGKESGSCSLNKEQQANQVKAFNGAVSLDSTSNGAKVSRLTLAPGTEIGRMTKDASLLKDTLSGEINNKISMDLGFAGAALNANSEGGASYSSLAVNIDLILSQIYKEVEQIAIDYTRVLNNLIDNKRRILYKIVYLRTSMLNQDKLISNAKDLYTLGSGSLKYWIACNGVDPDTYLSLMDEELQENIFDKFKPHMTSFVMNNDTNEAGRSKKDDSELTDSGIQTRTNGSNQLQRQNK